MGKETMNRESQFFGLLDLSIKKCLKWMSSIIINGMLDIVEWSAYSPY